MPPRHSVARHSGESVEADDSTFSLNRRTFLSGSAALAAAAAGYQFLGPQRESSAATGGPARDFIGRKFHNLTLGGRSWRRSGANAYYLPFKNKEMIDKTLKAATAMGLGSIRTWGFAEGPQYASMQPTAGEYPAGSLDSMDYLVQQAGKRDIRLIIALTNNWTAYGGMTTYAKWFGKEHDDFYRSSQVKDCYKKWIAHLTSHKNRYTGVPYNADPAIMAWELANEPRCQSDTSGNTLVKWADEMSQFVGNQAPKQLVCVGDEGFFKDTTHGYRDYSHTGAEGVDWRRLTALKAVDYGTVHLYPDAWNAPGSHIGWGSSWIREHGQMAYKMRKPVALEEYGLDGGANREGAIRQWGKDVMKYSYAMDQFWMLSVDGDGSQASPLNIKPGDSCDPIVRQHSKDMRAARWA